MKRYLTPLPWNWFLRRPGYIKFMAQKQPLDYDPAMVAETRLREFKQHFGEDLGMIDREFIAFMRQLN